MTLRGRVSCLCVTEGRSAFMPWLLWGYDRQTWRERELIVVDSSPVPWRIDRPDVRVIPAAPGTNVPTKRNTALAAATGTFVAWFDDDDWQHPQRLALLAQVLSEPRAAFAGGTKSFFVDLHSDACRRYEGYGTIIFNGAGFRREAAQSIRFNEGQRRASDTGWMQALAARGGRRVVAPQILTAWLSHEQNISNDRKRWRFPLPLSALRDEVGDAMWADTDQRLAALRADAPPARSPWPVLPTPLDRSLSVPSRAHQRATRLQQILRDQVTRRHPSRLVERPARGEPPPACLGARGQGAARLGMESPAAVALVVCFQETDVARADASLSHYTRLLGGMRRAAIALLCTERTETAASAEDEASSPCPSSLSPLPAWDAIVKTAAAGATDGGAPEITREALLIAVERAEGAEWLLLVGESGALVDAGQTSWIEPALSRLRADHDLVAIAIPTGGVRGARGTARGAPPGLKGAIWDGRLRLWRARGLTGLAFVAERARLQKALTSQVGAPDRPRPLAAVLENALGAARTAKSFGTLATKEAWTHRLPLSGAAVNPGVGRERRSM